ncbi:MAG: hypothetical protein EA356_12895 [Geminicoccaceae bacterium]|nr:MAG: hypothetical protein EA356_12895 [Geminicoccaceae bacterium]
MAEIVIHLFGPMEVDGRPAGTPIPMARSALQLLGFLALYADRPLPREAVAAELWPDCEPQRARARLSTAMWRLRAALAVFGCSRVLVCEGEATIGLDDRVLDAVDTRGFERRARLFLERADDLAWPTAEESGRARGVPLAGWYAHWALQARARLEDLRERGLTVLLQRQVAAKLDDAAIDTAQELLRIDPLREDVHQQLMAIYAGQGRFALVKRQYERCRQILEQELAVAPMVETRALAESAASWAAAPASSPVAGIGELEALRHAVAETQRNLATVTAQLEALLLRSQGSR